MGLAPGLGAGAAGAAARARLARPVEAAVVATCRVTVATLPATGRGCVAAVVPARVATGVAAGARRTVVAALVRALGARATGARSLVDRDAQHATTDAGPRDAVDRAGVEGRDDVDEGEAREDVDLAEVLALQAALVRERADDATGLDAVVEADGEAVARALRVAGAVLAARATVAVARVAAAAFIVETARAAGAALGETLRLGALLLGSDLLRVGAGTVVADVEGEHDGGELGAVDVTLVVRQELVDETAVELETAGLAALGDLAEERAGSVGGDVRGRRHLGQRELCADGALDELQAVALGGRHEADRLAGAAGTARAPDAVHVRLRLAREVEVDDEADAVDVEAAGGDIRRDEHVERARAEALDDLLALLLRDVARDGRSRDATLDECRADLLGSTAGAAEDDRGVGVRGREDAREGARLVAEGHDGVSLLDGGDRRGLARDRDLDGRREVLGRDAADLRWHRRGEERHLTLLRGLGEDLVDVLREAHAQHLVGLVEDEEADVGHLERAALHVVDHTAGRADDDLGATLERTLLRDVRGAAVHRDDLDVGEVRRERADGVGDLHRELTRRSEDEGLRGAQRRVDAREHRDAERGGLAGPGLGDTGDVAAREERGDRLHLDRGGGRET